MKYFTGDWLSDQYIMYDIIDQMEVVSGTDRNNILYVPKSQGGSNLFGYTWRSYLTKDRNRTKSPFEKLYYTKLRDMYPEFSEIAKEFRDLYFPDFKYSQVQINKNYKIPPHFDSKNVGESVLVAFGDYQEDTGLTAINLGQTTLYKDARDKPQKFNGSKFKHWVTEYEGTRYSLVFFHNMRRPEILV